MKCSCLVAAANLSFAALQLNADLGFSRSVYGFGSGMNLLLSHVATCAEFAVLFGLQFIAAL